MMTEEQKTLSLTEYTQILREEEEQPRWRDKADKEMDYADGNQLGSELLEKQKLFGIPPAIEDLIGPALLSIQGYEAATRTDWRVTPNGGTDGKDVADALNYKLNTAERASKADRACSEVFRSQIAVGLGWVEVSRESDPFKFPYRCTPITRNEITWDFSSKTTDLEDARWLRRKRWMRPERLVLVFPDKKDLINVCGRSGANWWADTERVSDQGGASTGLTGTWAEARGWTVEESRWYNSQNKELCLSELWYRRWESVIVLTAPDGRIVEFDEKNEAHMLAAAKGAKLSKATVARIRRSYWLGPHMLHDSESPYKHRFFPYVPFWGFREDRTAVPYGYVRGMVYQQDSLNSGTAKLRWGLGAVRTEYTKGAIAMTDAQHRKEVGRPDASIVLDAQAMAQTGARYEVKRDFQFNDQQLQMLNDARSAIQRVSPVTNGFAGRQGTATSGVQETTQVEQTNQSLGRMMDNFKAGRTQMGELLISMIVEDMGKEEHTIIIEGDAVKEDHVVVINKPEVDPETGMAYLSNDLQRTRLQVALEDVPSTASYRSQQLNAMSEVTKTLPDKYKAPLLPFMVSLMDTPFKRDVIEAIRSVDQQQTPEQIKQQIEQAVQAALQKSGADLKMRELDLKYSPERMSAEIRKIMSEVLKNNVGSVFAGIQTAEKIAIVPGVAALGDGVLMDAGWKNATPAGENPTLPQPVQPIQLPPALPNGDTSPLTPINPDSAFVGEQQGVETMRAD